MPSTDRGARRRGLLIEVATEEFLEKGYEGASLREIVRRGGGSSDTLYQHFGDKAGLFMACASHLCEQFMVADRLAEGRTPEDVLTAFGISYMKNFVTPKVLGIWRLMIAETPRFPELGKLMFGHGHDRVVKLLADYLQDQTRKGVLAIENCDLAARQFIGMIHGDLHYHALLLTGPAPTQAEIHESASTGARAFCRGYAAS